jgi:hypothetical protein
MFRQGPLPAFVHGVLEYAAGIFLVASSFLLDYTSDSATAVSIVAGVLLLAFTASSALPTGLIRSIPVQAHAVFDFIFAGLLVAAPFIFGFSKDGTATAVFIVLGIVLLLVTIATRFVRDPKPPKGERREVKPGSQAPSPARQPERQPQQGEQRPARPER